MPQANESLKHGVTCRLPRPGFQLTYYPAVAENQPIIKHRMNPDLIAFAAHMRELMLALRFPPGAGESDRQFDTLARELFALQFHHNPAYGKICAARGATAATVRHWTEIPAVPTAAFKELELSSIPAAERTAVFHSSGTTGQQPSRHFHCAASLALYETSLLQWYEPHFGFAGHLFILTPPPAQAPHSSLVHMFDTLRRQFASDEAQLFEDGSAQVCSGGLRPPSGGETFHKARRSQTAATAKDNFCHDFFGQTGADAAWELDLPRLLPALMKASQSAEPVTLLGTAFSFVHLVDYLAAENLRFKLPSGSRVLETGGYKNRSRTLPKAELHALIADRLGLAPAAIGCEYGMSELSSQAYDAALNTGNGTIASQRHFEISAQACSGGLRPPSGREIFDKARRSQTAATTEDDFCREVYFQFPPWARVQIISPETGREVAEGETGLIRLLDLANVFSVAAIQTEDLGVRRGGSFELLGRAAAAEPRGCSLNVGEVKS